MSAVNEHCVLFPHLSPFIDEQKSRFTSQTFDSSKSCVKTTDCTNAFLYLRSHTVRLSPMNYGYKFSYLFLQTETPQPFSLFPLVM